MVPPLFFCNPSPFPSSYFFPTYLIFLSTNPPSIANPCTFYHMNDSLVLRFHLMFHRNDLYPRCFMLQYIERYSWGYIAGALQQNRKGRRKRWHSRPMEILSQWHCLSNTEGRRYYHCTTTGRWWWPIFRSLGRRGPGTLGFWGGRARMPGRQECYKRRWFRKCLCSDQSPGSWHWAISGFWGIPSSGGLTDDGQTTTDGCGRYLAVHPLYMAMTEA